MLPLVTSVKMTLQILPIIFPNKGYFAQSFTTSLQTKKQTPKL